MRSNILLSIFLTLTFSNLSFARGYFELGTGYGMGTAEQTTTTSGVSVTDEDDYSGLGYSLQAGLEGIFFFLGAEYAAMPGTYKEDSVDLDMDQNRLGVLLGWQFHAIPLKFSFTYDFMNNTTLSTSGGDIDYSGKGFTLGVGYRIFRMFFLNLSHTTATYDEIESGGVKVTYPTANQTAPEYSHTMLSVSVRL